MSRSPRILVLGAGGMLGSHVVPYLSALRKAMHVMASAEHFHHNVALKDHLAACEPSTVINCAGHSGSDVGEHYKVNGCLPRAIADWCSDHEVLFVHVSTNALFAADEAKLWLPSDLINPDTHYEISKAFGEDPRAYIIRSSFIGKSPSSRGIFDTLRSGRPFVDRRWNGVTALTAAARIGEIVINHNGRCVSHLEHLHSPAVISFLEVARLLHSDSVCLGKSYDAKLLGGGIPVAPIGEQLRAYLALSGASTQE